MEGCNMLSSDINDAQYFYHCHSSNMDDLHINGDAFGKDKPLVDIRLKLDHQS